MAGGPNPARRSPDPGEAWARLRRDEDGSVTIWAAVSASVVLGLVGLALDLSREEITHSEAQAAADAAALAGAAQLDLSSGSCARAASAAQTLVANNQKFAGAGGAVTFSAANCLSGLPTSDATAIDSTYVTTTDTSARFLQVVTQQLTHNNFFMQIVGAPATATVQAQAVAGFRPGICNVPPLMMCNPDETGSGGQPFDPSTVVGREIWAKGGNSAPGNFGLLDNPACGTPSKSCIQTMLQANAPNECFGSTVSPSPGQGTGPTDKGINVRFGQSSSATASPDVVTTSYPDDSNYASSPTVGSGIWDCLDYWNANHAGKALPAQFQGNCTTATNSVTRYQMYQYEQSNPPTADQPLLKYAQSNRRIMYTAVVNCVQYGIKGNPGAVPYVGWLKILLIKPADQQDVWAEAIGLATPATDAAVVKDDVQLYR